MALAGLDDVREPVIAILSTMLKHTGFTKERLRRTVNKRWFSVTMLGMIVLVVVLGSFLVLHFEKAKNPEIRKYTDALWLSFVTMATVGYGDKVPITAGGKVTLIMEMVLGVSLLSGFIGARASLRAEKAQKKVMGLEKTTSLKEHYAVLGWNQRGKYVLRRLAASARKSRIPIVLLCNLDTSPVEDDYVFFYKGNPTSVADQKRANVEQARSLILLADEQSGGDPGDVDARTVLAALTAKTMNANLSITAEVLDPENVQHLQNAGVNEVFDHNLIGGNLIAQSALRPGVIEVVNALASRDANSSMYVIPLRPGMAGRTCRDVSKELRAGNGYELIGARKTHGTPVYDSDAVLEEGDKLVILSDREPPDAEKFSRP